MSCFDCFNMEMSSMRISSVQGPQHTFIQMRFAHTHIGEMYFIFPFII